MGGARKTIATSRSDWTRFGWDARRSNDDPGSTGITAANVGSLRRQQVRLPGTADSSAIYLHGVTVGGTTHDAFFVTTTYGITLAIDAASGRILWQWKPPGYSHWAGSAQITTATPVADPSRRWIYAASPDGRIQKLTVASGHAVWRRVITKLPSREKIAAGRRRKDLQFAATVRPGSPQPRQREKPDVPILAALRDELGGEVDGRR